MSEDTRKHEFEIEIDAPPEAVWKALTEGEEITRWFAPEARVQPGEGGTVWLSWGPGMEGEAPIHIWEPGRRFGWREGAGDSPRVLEFQIEGKGGRTVLRLVHSGFSAAASFDDEYESTRGGWLTFLAILRYGLSRFRGIPGRQVTSYQRVNAPVERVWELVTGSEGLQIDPPPSALRDGAPYEAAIPGGRRISGEVLRMPARGYLCLTVEALGGSLLALFVEKFGGATGLTVSWYLFGEAVAEAELLREEWKRLAAQWTARAEAQSA